MRFALLSAMVLFSGCGWLNDDKGIFVNRADDYLEVQETPELIIPPTLDSDRLDDPLPVPSIVIQANADFYPNRPPRPDAIFANDNRDEVRIQRLGERRWLVIPESPTTVWPKVKQFLADNGVQIVWESPRYGRINTEWMKVGRGEYRDVIREVIHDAKKEAKSFSGRDRLQVRVEQGLRERYSEVHIRHENDSFAVPYEELIDINDLTSAIPAVEADLLNELGAYIASKVSEQTVSRVAQEISAGVKSEVTRNMKGEPVLRLHLDHQRAWATVGQALTRAKVEVLALDEATGVYHVLIPESMFTGGGGGLFGGVFGGNDKYDLTLKVTETDESTFAVSVYNADELPADRELSQEVLTMIREFAS